MTNLQPFLVNVASAEYEFFMPFSSRWKTRLVAAILPGFLVAHPASADFFLGGMFPDGARILRVDESGQTTLSWGGVYESVGGFTLGNSGILYSMENRLGNMTVRGWDPWTGTQRRTLTTDLSGPFGTFGLPVTLATGAGKEIYAVGSYWNPFNPPGPPGPGVARLQEDQFVSGSELQPWIGYGAGGALDASDLAVDASGDLYLSDRSLGVLRYRGTTGEFLGISVGLSLEGLKSPDSLAFGPDGLLYVLDSSNSLQVYDPATGNRIRSPITAESGRLNSALSLEVTPEGMLWVMSDGGNSFLKVDPVSGNILKSIDISHLSTGNYLSPGFVYFQVPEPSTWWLALVGLGGVLIRRR